jgi:tetratricopeptide (TPR) repeat protein
MDQLPMRKINGKLFLGVLIGTAVAAVALFAVHQFQYQRIAQALLWQAHHAEEQGQIEREARYLSRYLEFNPHDDVQKARLGSLWAGDGFANAPRLRWRAVRLLDEVLAHDSNRPDLRRQLVKTALELGFSDSVKLARGHLEKLLAREAVLKQETSGPAVVDRDRGELIGFWGQLFEAESKPEEAMHCCRLAVRFAPETHTNYVRLAYLLRRQKESDPARRQNNHAEADECVERLVKANPTSHHSYLSRWRYRRDFDLIDFQGDKPLPGHVLLIEAANDVALARQRQPESCEVLLASADVERLVGQAAYDNLKATPAKREALLAEHRNTAYEYLQKGLRIQEAIPSRSASDGLRFQLLWHKGGLLLDDLKRADAKAPGDPTAPTPDQAHAWEKEVDQTVELVRKTQVSPAGADYLQGRVRVHERRWAEAAGLFEHSRTLLGSQPDLAVQVNLHLGQCYEQLEEPSQMLSAYQRVREFDPDSVAALLGIAAAEWSMQRLDSAATTYQQLVAIGKVPDKAWLDMARLQIQLQLQSNKPNWERVAFFLEQATKVLPDAIEVTLLRAEMWLAQKQPTKADDVLRQAQEKSPNEAELWAARIDLAVRRERPEIGEEVLKEAKERAGDSVTLRLAEARCLAGLLKKNSDDDAGRKAIWDRIDRLAFGADGMTEEDRGRLLSGLAHAQLLAGNEAGSRRFWQQLALLPRYETDLRLRLLLFDLSLKLNDDDGVEKALADIRKLERGEGGYARYGQALRRLERAEKLRQAGQATEAAAELAEARVLLDHVEVQRPNWPAVQLARSQVHKLEGNPDQAIKDLREAIKNGERGPEAIRELANLLMDRGMHEEASQELENVRESVLSADPGLGRLVTIVALRRQRYDEAWTNANKWFPPDSKNFKDQIFLGRVQATRGSPEAEQHFRKAIELAPQEPAAWVALVQFLAGQRRTADAEAEIQKARATLSAEKATLALAQCYEVCGNSVEAEKLYRSASDASPKDVSVLRAAANFRLRSGQVGKAEPLLRKILNGEAGEASAGDREWARHGLALVLANGTDFERFREALHLEGLRLDANGQLVTERGREEGTEQQKNQARVLATQLGQRQFRQAAIELFSALEGKKTLLPPDRYILALLYEADGKWQRAQAILRELANKPPASPQHIAQLVHSLLIHRDLDAPPPEEVEKWIENLEDLERSMNVGPNGFASVEMRARLYEARKQGDKALTLLRQHVNRPNANPEERLLELDSLRRQKRFDEAYKVCEAMWTKCKPEVAGGASVAILRSMKPTDAQVKLLEDRLKKASEANKKSTVLLLHLADLYDLRGRYPEAEQLYKKVLNERKEGSNIVALNNLAWLLAHREGGAPEALQHIQAAVNGIGRRADLLDTRGLVYLRLGKHDAALADFREANEDAPTPTRQFHLAKAYYDSRNRAAAMDVLKKAIVQGKLPQDVHPTEQDECRQLLEQLNIR